MQRTHVKMNGSAGICFNRTVLSLSRTDHKAVQLRRVAVALFGLPRSVELTAPSVRANVLSVLSRHNITVDIYAHSFIQSDVADNRYRQTYPESRYQFTSAESYQSACRKVIQGCRRLGDAWGNKFRSYQNHMAQLGSLHMVTQMWGASNVAYDGVMYVRPDILFNCPLPGQMFASFHSNTLYAPRAGSQPGYINDRFGFGSPEVMRLWGNRLDFTARSCRQRDVHAERNVYRQAASFRIKTKLLPLHLVRVRIDGRIPPADMWAVKRRRCQASSAVPFMNAKAKAVCPQQLRDCLFKNAHQMFRPDPKASATAMNPTRSQT